MPAPGAARRAVIAFAFFVALAYLIAPVSFGDRKTIVPRDREMDAIQQCLLIADGIDKLQVRPRSYYDTAILYPDRNQLRATEPFLGFVVLGLPLRTVVHLGDVDLFEVLRFGIVFLCLAYAYLFLTTVGTGAAIGAAGAVLCVCQPSLVNGIERLQVLSIPLLLPVLYHGYRAWNPGRRRPLHALALFFFAALYPLCGAINAVACLVAAACVLPLLLKTAVALRGGKRVLTFLLPILLAGVADILALAPWLSDRADLRVYTSTAFLEIKHWNGVPVPLRTRDILPFLTGEVGAGLALAAVALVLLAFGRRGGRRSEPAIARDGLALSAETYLGALVVFAVITVVGVASVGLRSVVPWLKLVFQVACYSALLLYWRDQWRATYPDGPRADRHAALLGAGVGVFMLLTSFGPLYVSNGHPLAAHLTRVFLSVVPPLASVREFSRFWPFGGVFLALYAAVRLGMALGPRSRSLRVATAAVVTGAALISVYDRQLVATADIEAPRGLIELASASPATGALYVHPYMKWNSMSGVVMIAAARELRRPIVNGYLGICPPYFPYAASVLHRFPDREALWLLWKWKVATVVSLSAEVGGEPECVQKVFENAARLSVWQVAACAGGVRHPSADGTSTLAGRARVTASWSAAGYGGADGLIVAVPRGFVTDAVEIRFGQSAVERIPRAVAVYEVGNGTEAKLNDGDSGGWIESLAADALLRRQSPVATIRVNRRDARRLRLEWQPAGKAPVERITLIGNSRE